MILSLGGDGDRTSGDDVTDGREQSGADPSGRAASKSARSLFGGYRFEAPSDGNKVLSGLGGLQSLVFVHVGHRFTAGEEIFEI